MKTPILKQLDSRPSVELGKIANLIKKFEEQEVEKTFGGLLFYCGLTRRDYESLEVENPQVFRLLTLYKEHLEAELEKMLIYRDKLKNHNAIMFVLKKSNPSVYGDKVQVETSRPKAQVINFNELTNSSGVDLYSTTKKETKN